MLQHIVSTLVYEVFTKVYFSCIFSDFNIPFRQDFSFRYK